MLNLRVSSPPTKGKTEADLIVEGEKVVSPSSIVNLNFRVRYVHPSSIVSKPQSKLALTSGDSHTGPNGIATPEEEKTLEEASKEKVEGVVADIKEKVEDVKDVVSETISKVVSEDKEDKEKVWEKNGYAHAPLWPQVSFGVQTCAFLTADQAASQTPLLGPTRRFQARQSNCTPNQNNRYSLITHHEAIQPHVPSSPRSQSLFIRTSCYIRYICR